jgi:hypothetical protein
MKQEEDDTGWPVVVVCDALVSPSVFRMTAPSEQEATVE